MKTRNLLPALLVTMPLIAHAGARDWAFVQSIGGINLGAPVRGDNEWTLPLAVDVSGLANNGTKPSTVNSALACERVEATRNEHGSLQLTVFTSLAGRGKNARCPAVRLGQYPDSVINIDYRDPDGKLTPIGKVTLEDSPDDTGSRLRTHCREGEFAYLNARMMSPSSLKNGSVFVQNGKVLSLCADRNAEPLGRLTYRYGAIGKVEMEKSATAKDKFSVFNTQTSPKTSANTVFFKSGVFTYYVTEDLYQGAATSIGLDVFKSGKRVAVMGSGTNSMWDFETSLITLDFLGDTSPIFSFNSPPDEIY